MYEPLFPYAMEFPEPEVTVGIALLSENSDTIILGTDLRSTIPGMLTPNEQTGKAWDLPEPFDGGIATAGILRDCQPFVDQLYVNFAKLRKTNPLYSEHIETAIDEARLRVWTRRANWAMKTSYGLSIKQWLTKKIASKKLAPMFVEAGRLLLQGIPFKAEALVAGYCRGQVFFYKASGKRVLEGSVAPGIMVIGTGGALALEHLNRRQHNAGCSFARALLHMVEALEAARKEPNNTVGEPSRFLVIHRDGTMAQFFPDAPTLLGWKRSYADRDSTWSLQNTKVADIQAKGMWQPHVRSQIKPSISQNSWGQQ
jgi:hypothetical protein